MNLDWKTEEQYIYYPYMVTMYDLSLSYQLVRMCPNHTFLRANFTGGMTSIFPCIAVMNWLPFMTALFFSPMWMRSLQLNGIMM